MSVVKKIRIGSTDYNLAIRDDTFTAEISTTWQNNDPPYIQVLTVSGILSTDAPIVSLVQSSTYETAQEELTEYAKIYKIAVTAANTVTIYATEKTTIPLNIKLRCIG